MLFKDERDLEQQELLKLQDNLNCKHGIGRLRAVETFLHIRTAAAWNTTRLLAKRSETCAVAAKECF